MCTYIIFIIIFVCMTGLLKRTSVYCVCVCLGVRKSEKGVRSLGIRVTDDGKPLVNDKRFLVNVIIMG